MDHDKKRELSVLVLTTSYPRNQNDWAGIFIEEFVEAISRYLKAVTVLSPHDKNAKKTEAYKNISIKRFKYWYPSRHQRLAYGSGIPINIRKSTLAKMQLIPFLFSYLVHTIRLSKKCDIIHANWIPSGLIGILAGAIRSKPVVVTVHGSDLSATAKSALWKKLAKFVFNRSDRIIIVSSTLLSQIDEIGNYRDKISILTNGVPDYFFSIKKETSIPENILFVGRLIKEKGIFELVEAFNVLSIHNENLSLTLVGSGSDEKDLEIFIKDRSLSSKVLLVGGIPKMEIVNYIKNTTIFVLPSYNEGAGLSMIEAMAAKTAVIGTNVGGIPGIIENRKNGLLVEPKKVKELEEALSLLIDNKYLRNTLAENAYKWADENCRWSIVAKKAVSIYGKIA